MSNQADQPAFPMQDAAVSKINAVAGLTKREYFAAKLFPVVYGEFWNDGSDMDSLSKASRMVAVQTLAYVDRMLAELDKERDS